MSSPIQGDGEERRVRLSKEDLYNSQYALVQQRVLVVSVRGEGRLDIGDEILSIDGMSVEELCDIEGALSDMTDTPVEVCIRKHPFGAVAETILLKF